MKKPCFLVFMMFLIVLTIVFISGVASANTIIAGKIYNSDYSNPLEGAKVTITCGSDSLETTSLSDGSYGVVFNTESCDEANSVSITASKDNLYGKGDADLYYSDENKTYVAIANIKVNPKESEGSTGSKGKSKSYLCGNNVCDSGETFQTCPKDCVVEVLEELPTNNETSNLSNLELEDLEIQNEENSNIAGITGAVTGEPQNKRNLIILMGAVLLIVITAITILFVRRK